MSIVPEEMMTGCGVGMGGGALVGRMMAAGGGGGALVGSAPVINGNAAAGEQDQTGQNQSHPYSSVHGLSYINNIIIYKQRMIIQNKH